jgi:hypothetical protein
VPAKQPAVLAKKSFGHAAEVSGAGFESSMGMIMISRARFMKYLGIFKDMWSELTV